MIKIPMESVILHPCLYDNNNYYLIMHDLRPSHKDLHEFMRNPFKKKGGIFILYILARLYFPLS